MGVFCAPFRFPESFYDFLDRRADHDFADSNPFGDHTFSQ